MVLSGTECSILSGTGKDWSNTREMKGRRTREKLKERDRDVSALKISEVFLLLGRNKYGPGHATYAERTARHKKKRFA